VACGIAGVTVDGFVSDRLDIAHVLRTMQDIFMHMHRDAVGMLMGWPLERQICYADGGIMLIFGEL
jgi:hypothetical protein